MCKNYLFPILVIILTFSNLFLQAQTDFRSGYIISNKHDTVVGYIDYRGDMRNCKVCVFKQTNDSPTIEYSPSDILAYRFTNSKYYVSKTIEIDSEPLAIFAEYLVDGIVDLYFYSNFNQSYYLIEQEGEPPILLETEEKNIRLEDQGNDYVYEYKKYVGILKVIFKEDPELFEEIDRAKLTHKSLASITKKYHDYVCDNDQCIVYAKEVPVVNFDVSIFGSMGFPNISVYEGAFYSENYQSEISPSISISTDVSLPQFNEKLSFSFSLNVGKTLFQATDRTELSYATLLQTLTIEAYPLDLIGGLKYTFPKGTIRPTLFLGLATRNLMKMKNIQRIESIQPTFIITTLSEKQVLDNFLPGLVASAGSDVLLKNGYRGLIKLEYKYFNHGNTSPAVKISTLNFCVGYYL